MACNRIPPLVHALPLGSEGNDGNPRQVVFCPNRHLPYGTMLYLYIYNNINIRFMQLYFATDKWRKHKKKGLLHAGTDRWIRLFIRLLNEFRCFISMYISRYHLLKVYFMVISLHIVMVILKNILSITHRIHLKAWLCKCYADIMGENGNARNKCRKCRLWTLKIEYQILRDIRSGRAKCRYAMSHLLYEQIQKWMLTWLMLGIQPAIFKLRWGAINIVADVGMVKPKCEDTALW